MLTYKRQQRYGPFWKRTTLKERYDAIQIPTFVIGGYYDGYRDCVPRMLEHLKAPVKAIMGPWHHALPHDAYPQAPDGVASRSGALVYDQWLKGRDTGIMAEPRFAVFVRGWHPPGPGLEEVPGEWRFEEGWPIGRIRERVLHPQPNHGLAEAAPADTAALAPQPAHERHRGRRPGHVVRRRGPRPAPHRRLEPGLRQRAPHGGRWRSWACPRPSSRSRPTRRSPSGSSA